MVASQPGNAMPAAGPGCAHRRPTRYFARTRRPSASEIDAGFILRDAGDLASTIDRYAEFTGVHSARMRSIWSLQAPGHGYQSPEVPDCRA